MKGTTVWHKMEFLHQQVDSKRAENIADLSTVCPQQVEDKGRSVRPTNIWYTPATGHRSHCQCSKSTVKETQRGGLSVMDGPPPAHKHCGVILTENRAEGRNIQRRARSVLLCKDCFCCLCLHMLRYIAAPVSHLWANYKEIIRSVHVSYTQRTARCWLHLPAAWTFTPVGRSADLTWLACSYHLLESTSSGVHKASKAAAIFNVVFGLRVYYRLQREKFSFCDLIRRSCEVGVSICDWEVCIWGVWIRCHPSNKCVPALLIYSTAVTQHHSVSCCQKFEPQTYRTSEMLFYGTSCRSLQTVPSQPSDLYIFIQNEESCWLQHSKNDLRVSITIPNYAV